MLLKIYRFLCPCRALESGKTFEIQDSWNLRRAARAPAHSSRLIPHLAHGLVRPPSVKEMSGKQAEDERWGVYLHLLNLYPWTSKTPSHGEWGSVVPWVNNNGKNPNLPTHHAPQITLLDICLDRGPKETLVQKLPLHLASWFIWSAQRAARWKAIATDTETLPFPPANQPERF